MPNHPQNQSQPNEAPNDAASKGGRLLRALLTALGAVVLAAVAAFVISLIRSGASQSSPDEPGPAGATSQPAQGSQTTPGSAASSSPAPQPTASPAGPTRPAAEPSTPGIPTRKPVPLAAPAPFGDGIVAQLAGVSRITSDAHGLGEIAGPAYRFRIALRNTTAKPLALDTVMVNLMLGSQADGVPASPVLGSSKAKPFQGTLKPGARTTGTYVFSLPSSAAGEKVRLTVSHSSISPIVVFAGEAPRSS